MVTIKIECDCGQRYAFDVEPLNGQMGCPVACPACGADGTVDANKILAHTLPPETPLPPVEPRKSAAVPPPPPLPVVTPSTPAPKAAGLKISATDHTSHAPARVTATASQLGLVEPEQAKHEARAKISWGNSQESVIQYLMVQGFEHDEASALVKGFYKERVAGVRANGFKQIMFAFVLWCVPIAVLLAWWHFKVMPTIFLGMGVAATVWGLVKLINGLILVLVPKVQSGDVSQD